MSHRQMRVSLLSRDDTGGRAEKNHEAPVVCRRGPRGGRPDAPGQAREIKWSRLASPDLPDQPRRNTKTVADRLATLKTGRFSG